MAELMRTLIQVKDPLTLIAFLSVIGLLAFRTRKVPELLFKLLSRMVGTINERRLTQLVSRFMVYGLVAFSLLIGVAVAGHVVAYKTQARALSLDDFKKEMRQFEGTEEQKNAALAAYSKGLALIQRKEFNQAIQSLQESIQATPSVTAQYTLAYLYQKVGNQKEASQAAAAAQSIADLRSDTMASLRIGRLADDAPASPAKISLIGPHKLPFPAGGHSFEEATSIKPGLYQWPEKLEPDDLRYFKLRLKAGQKLTLEYRTNDAGGTHSGSTIYDAEGGRLDNCVNAFRSERCALETTAVTDSVAYLSVGSSLGVDAKTVFVIGIQ